MKTDTAILLGAALAFGIWYMTRRAASGATLFPRFDNPQLLPDYSPTTPAPAGMEWKYSPWAGKMVLVPEGAMI